MSIANNVNLGLYFFWGCSSFTSNEDYIKQLGYEDPKIRDKARQALVERGKEAVPALLKSLDTAKFELKVKIISILGEIKDPSAVPSLLKILEKENIIIDDLQEKAMEVLVSMDANQVMPLLITALSQKKISEEKIESIIIKFGKTAVSYLINTLKNPDPYLRAEAALLLGAIKDDRATDPLIELLNDPSETVRFQAKRALKEMNVLR